MPVRHRGANKKLDKLANNRTDGWHPLRSASSQYLR
jgi:hypothetical protein